MNKKIFCALCAFVFSFNFAGAEIAVTVYNNNIAIIKDSREIDIKIGVQKIEFDDVAAYIEPTSVLPKFLKSPDKIKVLEQNFDYDLVSTAQLLSKYIGKEIEIERIGKDKRDKIKGTLLSSGGGLVVQTDKKIILNPEGEVSLEKIPEGLRLKPTLTWLVFSETAGKEPLEISYQTSGMSWNADYVLVTDEKDEKSDITGWVTISNRSGAAYKNAKLKLVAGDVNIVRPRMNYAYAEDAMYKSAVPMMAGGAPSFQEKSFFEYHIYELQRKTDLKNNEIKQIEFTSARNIPINKVFTFNASVNPKVTVNLEFKNSEDNNLGMPLPKGRVRVFKYDGDSMEFVGEDQIDHTPKDAKLSIYTGNAFDITGERIQTNYKTASKSAEESVRVTVKNSKDVPVEVNIVENMSR
ncbi:MAG: DUF4139 domain-containing protein, partial [Endomicrobia bacterium]|nr:DUF4139 domain-containing protein [Endomicrobiia bacterium]